MDSEQVLEASLWEARQNSLIIFGKPNDIRIWSLLESRMIFVLLFGHFWEAE